MTETVSTQERGTGPTTASLFEPLRLRDLEVSNRLWLSPMCQYSAVDGIVNDWHLAHLGDRASGGWGLLFTEATAVSARGRISPGDAGIWTDAQQRAWSRVVEFVHARGTPIALQLAHAGRKASLPAPWSPRTEALMPDEGGWVPLSVTDVPFPGSAVPEAASAADLASVVADFAAAARRGVDAGFDAIEILAGHGFLIHSFLSPLTNTRRDECRDGVLLLREIVRGIRTQIPRTMPLLVRLSSTDWLDGGLTDADTARIAERLLDLGVDMIDISSGGILPADIPVGPGYQVPGSETVREQAGVPTSVAGLITDPGQAARIVGEGHADAVKIGRAALRDPCFAHRAAHALREETRWQPQYTRGAWD
ncbi:MAG: NADH:flavin oxidoreductase/NADH oxidase [Galactobacter sp.]